MAWMTNDFECKECSLVFEEMYRRSERELVSCPECGSNELTKLLSSPNLATFSMKSPEQQRESLMKRSEEHTQKLVDKEPEKFPMGAGMARRTKKKQVGYGD